MHWCLLKGPCTPARATPRHPTQATRYEAMQAQTSWQCATNTNPSIPIKEACMTHAFLLCKDSTVCFVLLGR